MLNRVLLNIKQRSKVTLRSWGYQCEFILAQRSRRIQQLFTFYHRVYGPLGLRQVLRHYRTQLQPPLRGIVLSTVGIVGLNASKPDDTPKFDWTEERLSLQNFDACRRDIEFIDTLPLNKLCAHCKAKQMKYCYCLLGNRKCLEPVNCHKSMPHSAASKACCKEGRTMIEMAEEKNWEPYLSKNEFSIWKREERTSMFSYKVYARFDDITAQDLLHVQTDLDYRRQWDQTAVALHMIEEDPYPGLNSHLIYWEMQWPKLFANRDYVYCRRFVVDEKTKVMMICNRGTRHPSCPASSDKVRVTNYWSFMVIKPFRTFQEPGVHYILTYYDDPGLPIPQSIKSWVAQKQMPDFLKKMYNATKQYSCKSPLEMKKLHNLTDLNIANNDYNANAERSSILQRMWRQREAGK